MAAVLACGPGAVVSHRTAAKLHGLLDYNGAKLDITVAGRRGRRRGQITVHGSTTLAPKDVTVVDDVPCTTVARTLVDLGEVVDRRRQERAFDQAEVEEVLDMTAIADQLDRNSTRSAARRTKALLAEHYPGTTPTAAIDARTSGSPSTASFRCEQIQIRCSVGPPNSRQRSSR